MKNQFIRFAIVVFLSSMGAMSLAGTNPNLPNPAGSKQGLVIKPENVMMAEQLLPAVKNGVCLPRDLVSTDPELNEAIRSYKNGQGDKIPTARKEVENNQDCHELPHEKAILHDFNDQFAEACNLTPDMRAMCYVLAGFEYLGAIPNGTVLNVDGQHNVKFVCANGEEYVFDKDGNFISNGINEGTFNLANPEEEPIKHIFDDILAAVRALPQKSAMSKDEFYSFLEEYIEEHKITIPQRNNKQEEKVRHDEKNVCVADKIPDLTNLINLMNQSIEHLRKINAMSQKPSEHDRVAYNELVGRIGKEIEKFGKTFDEYSKRMNLTLTQKEQLSKKFEETIEPYLETMMTLMQQIEAKGYWHFTLDGSLGSSTESQ